MKKILKRIAKEEGGQVFILALVLLIVGGLVITPLLNYMGTGLKAGQTFENETEELYAADAGVEDAMWQLQQGDLSTIEDTTTAEAYGKILTGLPPYVVDHDDDPDTDPITFYSGTYSIADVNGLGVVVTIQYLDGTAYRIVSTAGSATTTIEAFVTDITSDLSGITDNVITTPNSIDWSPGIELTYPEGNGPVEGYGGYWPQTPEEIEDFSKFFFWDVRGEIPLGDTIIDLAGADYTIGNLYIDGTLDIINSSHTDAKLTLDGTIYVTGNTLIGKSGFNFVLDLDANTIFVESATAGSGVGDDVLVISGGHNGCTIEGPGVLVAIGDIYFNPKIEVGMENPILIMSVNGTTTMNPGGKFYGAVAGDISVDPQPNIEIEYPDGGFDGTGINFPGFTAGVFWGILSWKVT